MTTILRTASITTLAFLLTAGVAIAQNESTITQDGSANEATVEQVFKGSHGMNVITVDQDGDGNKVLEYGQRGSGNDLDITQSGDNNVVREFPEQGEKQVGAYSYNGLTTIEQTGNENEVWDADQQGFNNTSTIDQRTDGNFVDVEAQITTDGDRPGNEITITQKGGDANSVGVSTAGSKGDSGLLQDGSDNAATLTQNGSDNRIGTGAVSTAPNAPSDLGFRGKEGGPASQQSFVQAGTDNSANITQDGSMNTVEYVLQDSRGYASGNTIQSATGGAMQRGSGHTARFSQVGGNNLAELTQTGSGHVSSVHQTGSSNNATVTQSN